MLSLNAPLQDGAERAATRRDDWRAFVRAIPDDAEALPAGRRKEE